MSNPYIERVQRQRHGTKAEKRTAKRLNGRLTPASGALAGAKGDMRVAACLMEMKVTKHGSLSLKHSWLKKIAKEALDIGRTPALNVQFVDSFGQPIPDGSWVMIPERVFKEHFE